MATPAPFLWLAAQQRLVIHLPPSPQHFQLFLTENDQRLGELLPQPHRDRFLALAFDSPGTVELRRGRSGPAVLSQRFLREPVLQPRVVQQRVTWQPVAGQVEVALYDWGRPPGQPTRQPVPGDGGWPVPASWADGAVSIVLTPIDGTGARGPSVAVPGPLPQRPSWLAWLEPLTGSPVPPAILDALRTWPAPVLASFLGLLSAAAAQAGRSARAFPACVCEVLGCRARDWAAFLDVYIRRPEAVHLFAASVRLLGLVRNRGLGFGGPVSAGDILARIAGNGAPDDLLRERIDAGGDDFTFWVRALFENTASPALRWLRLERGCTVEPVEAEEVAGLLRQLDEQPVDGLADELFDGSSLRRAVTQAGELRQAALAGATAAAIRSAAAAVTQARTAVREHLDALLRLRPPGRWQAELGPLRQRLEAGGSLAELAAGLSSLRQGNEAAATPGAEPDCLLRLDAWWLHEAERARREQQVAGARVRAWCKTVLEEARLEPLALAGPAEMGPGPDELHQSWLNWQQAWDAGNMRHLVAALEAADLARSAAGLRGQIEQAAAQLPESDPSTAPTRTLLQELAGEALRLMVWLQRDRLRQQGEKLCDRLEGQLACAEARAQGAEILGRLRPLLAGPVGRWSGVPELVDQLRLLADQQDHSTAAWAALRDRLSPALLAELGLSARLSPFDDGLDVLIVPVREHLPRARQAADERLARLGTMLEMLTRLAGVLGCPAPTPAEPLVGDSGDEPRLGRAEYRGAVDLAQVHARISILEAVLPEARQRLRDELRRRVETAVLPPAAPGICLPAPAGGRADADCLYRTLEAHLEAGDDGKLAAGLARLEATARVLSERRDLLGLEQAPAGLRLLSFAQAPAWSRHAGDAELVRELQALAGLSFRPEELLEQPGLLEARAFACRQVLQGRPDRPRRWWSRLYRELAEVVRGKLDALPRTGPPWQPPPVGQLAQLGPALDWLANITSVLGPGTTVPGPLALALGELDLLPPTVEAR